MIQSLWVTRFNKERSIKCNIASLRASLTLWASIMHPSSVSLDESSVQIQWAVSADMLASLWGWLCSEWGLGGGLSLSALEDDTSASAALALGSHGHLAVCLSPVIQQENRLHWDLVSWTASSRQCQEPDLIERRKKSYRELRVGKNYSCDSSRLLVIFLHFTFCFISFQSTFFLIVPASPTSQFAFCPLTCLYSNSIAFSSSLPVPVAHTCHARNLLLSAKDSLASAAKESMTNGRSFWKRRYSSNDSDFSCAVAHCCLNKPSVH